MMSGSQGSLAASVRELVREERRGLGPHPEAGELLDYHAGRLADDDRERLQDHLILCPACSDTVLDMANFPDLEPAVASRAVSDDQVAAEWRAMAERRQQKESSAAVVPFADRSAESRRGAREVEGTRPVRTLAAIFLAACLGLAFFNLSLRREIAELRSPRVNPLARSLFAADQLRQRQAATSPAVPSFSHGEELNLSLAYVDADPARTYQIELLDSESTRIWHSSGLQALPDRPFTIDFPANYLPTGEYLLRLYDHQTVDRELLSEYLFAIH